MDRHRGRRVAETPVTIALPIADRRRSFEFYGDGLGFTVPGEPAEDGMPEPLRVTLGDHVRVMLIPAEGFGWVLGDRTTVGPGQSECIVSLAIPTRAEVDDLLARASSAGADVIRQPSQMSWGYEGSFADPDGHVWQVVEAGQFLTTWP